MGYNWITHAERETHETYGYRVSAWEKKKSLHKFGGNTAVGTSEATLMGLGGSELAETYVSTNAITHLSSGNDGDTQTYNVQGHVIDANGKFTFVVQDCTITGQTKKALTTPLARISRLKNGGSTNNAGTIYGFEDDTLSSGVPDTDTKVHITVPIGLNQSHKCATTFSNEDVLFITHLYASLNERSAANATIRFKIREQGKVFRTVFTGGIHSAGSYLHHDVLPYLIIPANADIIMTATADGGGTDIAGAFNGVIAKIIARDT